MNGNFDFSKLFTLIHRRGENLESIGKICGVSRVSMSRKLNGKQPLTQDEILKIAKYLRIPIEEIGIYFFDEFTT